MNLFQQGVSENLLPYDGIAEYHGCILNNEEKFFFLEHLKQTIPWRHDEGIMFGKKYKTARKVAWYGDREFEYNYANNTKKAQLWTPALNNLKLKVEKASGSTFNSCLLNLYHNGDEGMSWHSDAEKELLKNGAIASLSLGAARKFSFKHKKSKQKIDLLLDNGSLLLMKGEIQQHWMHQLPRAKKVNTPRINLTFRTIIE